MARIGLMVVGVCVVGIAAKTYSIAVGEVDKAKLSWFTVAIDGKKISAECYWTLIDTNGMVLASPQKTVVSKKCDVPVKRADLRAFLVTEFMDHYNESKVKFTDSVEE